MFQKNIFRTKNLVVLQNSNNYIKGNLSGQINTELSKSKIQGNQIDVKLDLKNTKPYLKDTLYNILNKWLGQNIAFNGKGIYDKSELSFESKIITDYLKLSLTHTINLNNKINSTQGIVRDFLYEKTSEGIAFKSPEITINSFALQNNQIQFNLNGKFNTIKIFETNIQNVTIHKLQLEKDSITLDVLTDDEKFKSKRKFNK